VKNIYYMENKNITRGKTAGNQAPDLPTENPDKHLAFEQMEKVLNSKILKITMRIRDHYPELSKYLEEMPETVPSENDPEITLNHLRSYYESLNSILNKYKVDYPKIEE
jgi:hypothetical protein